MSGIGPGPSPGGGGGASEWNAGTVSALGSGLAISAGTIEATGTIAQEWTAGTVTALGSGLAISAGTIAATGGGAGGNGQVVTFDPWTRPALSAFTQVNFGTTAATDTPHGALTLLGPVADIQLRGLSMPVPSAAPWTLTAELELTAQLFLTSVAALFVSDGTKFQTVGFMGQHASAPEVNVEYSTYQSITSGVISTISAGVFSQSKFFFRIHNDGTNLTFSFSNKGDVWIIVTTTAVGLYLGTITSGGIAVAGDGSQIIPTRLDLTNWEFVAGSGSTTIFQAQY